MLDQEVRRFSATDAAELYDVARWGKGYFSIDDNGHVRVHPTKDPDRGIDGHGGLLSRADGIGYGPGLGHDIASDPAEPATP